MKFSQYVFSFLMGYFIYSMIEIINRGYTHWTMSLTGGFILALLYSINSSGGMSEKLLYRSDLYHPRGAYSRDIR